MILIDLMGKEL